MSKITSLTVSTTSVAFISEIAAMPDLDGWGNLTSLQQAMARDTTGQLKTLGTQADPAARDATLNSIFYYWAGVQDVEPASRSSSMFYGGYDYITGDWNTVITGQYYLISETLMIRAQNNIQWRKAA